ncbi:MAG: hypothetical protein ACYC6G_17185 [Desulfobaccales bacterium]
MSGNAITLRRFAYKMVDYIQALNENADVLEAIVNEILPQLTGQSGSISVPSGLQEIFDRRGLIGADSYDFSTGTLSGPDYNLGVAAGAYWNSGTFLRRSTSLNLSLAGKATGTYYLNLDGAGNPLVSSSPDATTTRQFAWDASSHAVSNKTLYTGVAILFDGDDYADMLTSAARSKSFSKVADRLEEIEALLARMVQTPTPADTIAINWALGSQVRVLLNRAITTFAFSGGYDGQKCVLELIQDSQGGRAAAFGAEVGTGIDLTLPVPLSQAANKRDFLGFIYSAGNLKFDYVSLSRGF